LDTNNKDTRMKTTDYALILSTTITAAMQTIQEIQAREDNQTNLIRLSEQLRQVEVLVGELAETMTDRIEGMAAHLDRLEQLLLLQANKNTPRAKSRSSRRKNTDAAESTSGAPYTNGAAYTDDHELIYRSLASELAKIDTDNDDDGRGTL
jgi:hypothetical protein